ncbi:MAG: phospholipase A [Proteobacteria bacterium]|nr:phospholipase A [Pseudomonadota bacterium]
MKYRLSRTIALTIITNFFLFSSVTLASPEDIAQKKETLQTKEELNPYLITLYEPTYIMPFSYTSSFNQDAESDMPESASLNHIETKFQFSVKAAILRNLLWRNSLNLAYTQLSFWQVYNKKTQFFRESDYQPEIFLANNIDKYIFDGWSLVFFNIGAYHQSNGRGGTYERSWNRVYAETIFSKNNWLLSVRPWYVIPGDSLDNNPDIAHYLGYERILLSYQFHKQTLSLVTYNWEHISRTSAQLTWSFPLVRQFRGYVQAFSGYGQSLIEYNNHTNSISVGIALNDWL